jgi:hypothetical protein
MVSGVCGDDESVCALSETRGDCEKNTIAKWNDCLLHGWSVVMRVRGVISSLQQRGTEVLADESQMDDLVADQVFDNEAMRTESRDG